MWCGIDLYNLNSLYDIIRGNGDPLNVVCNGTTPLQCSQGHLVCSVRRLCNIFFGDSCLRLSLCPKYWVAPHRLVEAQQAPISNIHIAQSACSMLPLFTYAPLAPTNLPSNHRAMKAFFYHSEPTYFFNQPLSSRLWQIASSHPVSCDCCACTYLVPAFLSSMAMFYISASHASLHASCGRLSSIDDLCFCALAGQCVVQIYHPLLCHP